MTPVDPTVSTVPTVSSPDTLASIARWFALAVPAPTAKNKSVQLGCHFEEVAEMMHAVGERHLSDTVTRTATYHKQAAPVSADRIDPIAFLDSLCDQIVTLVGVAHMHALDIEGALAEVNRSNYSKFVDGKPLFDANGKIDKRHAGYSQPDLTSFVGPTHAPK